MTHGLLLKDTPTTFTNGGSTVFGADGLEVPATILLFWRKIVCMYALYGPLSVRRCPTRRPGLWRSDERKNSGFWSNRLSFNLGSGLDVRLSLIRFRTCHIIHHSIRDWYFIWRTDLFVIYYLFVVNIFCQDTILWYGIQQHPTSNTSNNSIQIQFNHGLGADAAALPSATLSTLV